LELGIDGTNIKQSSMKLRLLAKFLGVLTFGHHLKELGSIWGLRAFGESVPDLCRFFQGKQLDPLQVAERLTIAQSSGRLAYGARFERDLHSRIPLSFTPLLCLKRCHACDQYHSTREVTPYRVALNISSND
jgi:hypothetical protein